MRTLAAMLIPAALAITPVLAPSAWAQAPPGAAVPQEIGSWRLSCVTDRMTDRADCLLRHREPIERAATAGGSSLVLEVADRSGRLVPLVAARDLTLEQVSRGVMALTGTAQLRFPPNRLFEMPCALEGRALVCAPKLEDGERAAAELAAAPAVLVRMVGYGAGTGMAEPVELRLDATRDALARYRAAVPEGSAPPPPFTGATLPDLMQRLQRLMGN